MAIFRLPPVIFGPMAAPGEERRQWGIDQMKIPHVWKETKGKARVAVLDTGCDYTHAGLDNCIVENRDFTGSFLGSRDKVGHGTHCAGIVHQVAPEAEILNIKVLGDDGSGQGNWIAAGIQSAIDRGANVISGSFGSSFDDPIIREAVKAAIAAGCFVAFAAGNSGPFNQAIDFPARYSAPLAVAAYDKRGELASFSSRGDSNRLPDFAFPGVEILSTVPGGSWQYMSGTSMATPFAAGVMALLIAKHRGAANSATPLRNQAEMREHFQKVTVDQGPVGPDKGWGWGIVDAVKLVESDAPVAPPPADDELTLDFCGIPIRLRGDSVTVDLQPKQATTLRRLAKFQ